MSEISSLPANIVAWLETREELSYIKFLTEYPAIKKAIPLKKTIVAVGIDNMNITDSFVENDEGVLVENEYCRTAQIKLRLSIHAPFSAGGEACHSAFTDIIDCLSFESGLDIILSGCESIVSDRDTDAFVLTGWVSVNASLCPAATSSLKFPSFLNKDLLCGSHITNDAIHLSEKQQLQLDSPLVTGSYIGSGSSTQTVDIGFKPRLVIAFANGLPLMQINHATDENKALFAVASASGQTMGINITANGFKVTSSASVSARGCSPFMNELAVTYHYIAMR